MHSVKRVPVKIPSSEPKRARHEEPASPQSSSSASAKGIPITDFLAGVASRSASTATCANQKLRLLEGNITSPPARTGIPASAFVTHAGIPASEFVARARPSSSRRLAYDEVLAIVDAATVDGTVDAGEVCRRIAAAAEDQLGGPAPNDGYRLDAHDAGDY